MVDPFVPKKPLEKPYKRDFFYLIYGLLLCAAFFFGMWYQYQITPVYVTDLQYDHGQRTAP